MAAQLTLISGLSQRVLCWCSRLVISSLPVPLSPVTSTVLRVGATWRTTSRIFANAGLRPMTSAGWLSDLSRFLRVRFSSRSAWTSSVRADELDEVLHAHGLGEVVGGALLERLDGGLHRALAGDDDHREERVELLEGLQEDQPVHAGHHQVGQDEVRLFRARQLQALGPRAGAEDGVALVLEPLAHRRGGVPVVVGDEDRLLHRRWPFIAGPVHAAARRCRAAAALRARPQLVRPSAQSAQLALRAQTARFALP